MTNTCQLYLNSDPTFKETRNYGKDHVKSVIYSDDNVVIFPRIHLHTHRLLRNTNEGRKRALAPHLLCSPEAV